MQDRVYLATAMFLYLVMVLGIGVYYYRQANENSENYFLGGRTLGPLVTALSAEASDMSGWLLMGLPGVAYFTGLADAFWTAMGLGIGTYINWRIVAKRLRVYSEIAGNSITLPEYFSNRFKDKSHKILFISAVFILIFFVVYAASCFVTVGKLFSTLFGIDYKVALLFGALFVILYTFIGGFLAESASDLMQAIVMVIALVAVVSTGLYHVGGLGNMLKTLREFPGFLEFFGIANPLLENGTQVLEQGKPLFGQTGSYGLLTVISTLSWGLGYFGMPQVLLRFMAIRDVKEVKTSRRIATVWVFVSLSASVLIGLVGRALFPTELLTASVSENVFIFLSTKIMPAFFAGIMMAGILAATISSSDSYLLIASSAVAKDIFAKRHIKASDNTIMKVSRLSLIVIAIVAIFLALDENNVIFRIVSFAWAGFGATFGPIMLCSVFYKKTSREAAISGMVAGGVMVFVWNLWIKKLGGIFTIYELFPAFVFSLIVIFVVSKIKPATQDVLEEYEIYQKKLSEIEQ